ncbi:MAG TPA: tetratricopeptide repeat protein [Bryobacteraceae bacterium]
MTLAFLAFLALQAVSPEVAQHARAGLAAKQQGNLTAAIAEFQKVTELAPNLAAGFVNLGAAYLDAHQYSAAIAPLKKALALNPQLPGADQMLGLALLSSGYAAEAIPHLQQTQGALGIAQLKTGKLTDAIANLSAALKQQPNDPDLLYYLGRASGLFSKQILDSLDARHPDSARAHQALAENYAVLRQVPEAEKEYREALRLRPDTPDIHLALGRLYAAASQWAKAEQEFRAEIRIQPGSAEAAYRLGTACLEQGKLAEARKELERSDKLQPGMPETLYSLGKAALLQNEPNAAQAAWTRLLTIEKDSALAAQAHFGLAGIYRKQGKTAEAEREMSEFRRLQAK